MGEETSTGEPNPKNPKNRVDARGQHISAGISSAGGESTVDTTEKGAAAMAENRICIGPYVLIRKLGEGGMGIVWLAEQTAPVRRSVALKLIRSGFYDDSVLQRFKSEQQSLAVMNHPAIAKVFDAGTIPDGQPYFAMEYVEGASITRYCDDKKLKIRDRLELFVKVCEGVQHAHQKAIIHRDLKPSNVLVAEIDGKSVPRIIDFGIAKAIASEAVPDRTLFTQAGAFVGTPGFVSPEQAAGAEDVDTRADVYSLGIILYVLLTGTLPFDTEQWKKRPLDEVLRQLREDDPPTPSSKLSFEKEATQTAAEQRCTVPRELQRLLRGDLDWIALKAIDKDRAHRYGAPNDLATDIRRYLNNEPVAARPASTIYNLRKYIRRHRVGVAVSAAAVVLLIAFAAAQAVEIRRITRERDRANRITDFMTSMFRVSNPNEARGNTITAREVLDEASASIGKGLENDPELQAQLLTVMGTTYETLGLYAQAQVLHERAANLRRQSLGSKARDTLTSEAQVAWDLSRQGRYPEAEKQSRDVLDVQRQILRADDPRTLDTMYNLSWILHLEGRNAEAEKLDRETFERRRRVLGPEHPRTLAVMGHLALDLENQGKINEAVSMEKETLAIQRRVLGPDSPDTLVTMTNLANVFERNQQYPDAEKLQRETMEIERRVLGPNHPNTLRNEFNLAGTLAGERRYGDAEKLGLQTLDETRHVLGPDQPETVLAMQSLAYVYGEDAKFQESVDLYRQILEIQRRVLGPNNVATIKTMEKLGDILTNANRYADAEKTFRETLTVAQPALGPDDPLVLASRLGVANALESEGRKAEAEKMMYDLLDAYRRVLGPENEQTLSVMADLAGSLMDQGKLAEARTVYEDTLAIQRRVLGVDNATTCLTIYNLACNAARSGRTGDAITLLNEAIDHRLPINAMLTIDKDTDLKSLHGDPRFSALVARAKQKAAAAQKSK